MLLNIVLLLANLFQVLDEHPSFGFRYDNRGKLKGKDFAGYFHGDCFDAAALVIGEIIHKNVDISNKGWFIFVLKHIAYTFRNIIYGKDKDETINEVIADGIKAVTENLLLNLFLVNGIIMIKTIGVNFMFLLVILILILYILFNNIMLIERLILNLSIIMIMIEKMFVMLIYLDKIKKVSIILNFIFLIENMVL